MCIDGYNTFSGDLCGALTVPSNHSFCTHGYHFTENTSPCFFCMSFSYNVNVTHHYHTLFLKDSSLEISPALEKRKLRGLSLEDVSARMNTYMTICCTAYICECQLIHWHVSVSTSDAWDFVNSSHRSRSQMRLCSLVHTCNHKIHIHDDYAELPERKSPAERWTPRWAVGLDNHWGIPPLSNKYVCKHCQMCTDIQIWHTCAQAS